MRQDPAAGGRVGGAPDAPRLRRLRAGGDGHSPRSRAARTCARTRPSPSPPGDGWYELTGHKWFCTHPVFEVFFTLAQTEAGITCFVAERPHPGFRIQRLKDKLGGRCLASSEVEYDHLPARILGEEGRGTAFIVEQLV